MQAGSSTPSSATNLVDRAASCRVRHCAEFKKTDGLVVLARCKPRRHRVVERGFATAPGWQRRGFVFCAVSNTALAAKKHARAGSARGLASELRFQQALEQGHSPQAGQRRFAARQVGGIAEPAALVGLGDQGKTADRASSSGRRCTPHPGGHTDLVVMQRLAVRVSRPGLHLMIRHRVALARNAKVRPQGLPQRPDELAIAAPLTTVRSAWQHWRDSSASDVVWDGSELTDDRCSPGAASHV